MNRLLFLMVPFMIFTGTIRSAEPVKTIETLWVSDQMAGLMGMLERKQERWLISPAKVWYQRMKVRVNNGSEVEVSSDVSLSRPGPAAAKIPRS